MEFLDFVAFYNAYVTDNFSKLIILGWADYGGWIPQIEVDGSQIKITFEDDGSEHNRRVAPFVESIDILGSPKSIDVLDPHGIYHIQVYGLPEAESGNNEPGAWVKSA